VSYSKLASDIIQQWKNSSAHNAIMLDPQYNLSIFGSSLSPGYIMLITRNNLQKYNRNLLVKIENICPDFFNMLEKKIEDQWMTVYCTGMFSDREFDEN